MRRIVLLLLSIAILALGGTHARAGFPDKPITLIVPFMSTADVFGTVAQGLSEKLGVPVKIEVHEGTGGLRAMLDLLGSKPTGYTLGMGVGPNLIMSFYDKPPYRLDGLVYLGLTVAFQPPVLVVPKSYTGSLAELVARMRTDGRAFVWASAARTTAHMTGLEFMTSIGAPTVHQNTRNAVISLATLIGGYVDAAIESGSFVSAAIARGAEIRPIAVLADTRHPAFPGVQTPAEIGITDHFRLTAANVLVAPPGTPPEVSHRLRVALYETMHDPKIVARIRAAHFDVSQEPLSCMESAALEWLSGERSRWDHVRERYGVDLLKGLQ